MAGVNISNVNTLFLRYLPGAVETMNHESKGRAMFQNIDNWTGDQIDWRVHVRRSGAIGATSDGGAFSTPAAQVYATAKAGRKFMQGQIQLTDGVMAAAAKSKNVAVDVVESETRGLMRELMKLENGLLYGDGTGIMATAQSTESSFAGTYDDARFLWEGVAYDVVNASGTKVAGDGTSTPSIVVSTVTEAPTSSNTFTMTRTDNGLADASIDASTDKYIVWKNSYNLCPTGLDAMVDDAAVTFQNVAVGTYPRYKSLVLANSGTKRDLTPTLFRQTLAGLFQKSGNERPSGGLITLTNSWQSINVEEMYEGELRLTPDATVAGLPVASFKTTLGRVDIVVDSDAKYGKMFFVDRSKIKRAVQRPLSWRRDGGQIFKRSDVAGVHTATCLEVFEYYILERHTSAKIEDLSESPATAY